MLELLPLVGIALLFWLFIIRPASQRQKELRRMQSSLNLGDEVVLTSGVYGTLRELEDDHVLLEVSDGVLIKVARGAIGGSVAPTEDRGDEPAENDETGTAAGSEEN